MRITMRLIHTCLILVLILWIPNQLMAQCDGTATKDQSTMDGVVDPPYYNQGNGNLAWEEMDNWQSFTAGITGHLKSIELLVRITPNTSTNPKVRIYEGEGTNGTLLAEENYIPPTEFAWEAITISNCISLTAGNQYTIWMETGIDWAMENEYDVEVPYAGGYQGNSPGYWDRAFATYVVEEVTTPPPPPPSNNDGPDDDWVGAGTGLMQPSFSDDDIQIGDNTNFLELSHTGNLKFHGATNYRVDYGDYVFQMDYNDTPTEYGLKIDEISGSFAFAGPNGLNFLEIGDELRVEALKGNNTRIVVADDNGTLTTIPMINTVSGADDMGNHIATTVLQMNGHDIRDADHISIGMNPIPEMTTVNEEEYRLFVNGGALFKEVLVQETAFPDYVFAKGYRVPTLQEVATHIQEKGHLPNMPSAKEIALQGGIPLGEMTVNQQEKIEQLFLHLIDMEQQIKMLNKRIQQLEAVKQ